jgi:general secretion pathway protein D
VKSDEVVTQIIPVRYASATQLMNNLQVLLPTSATLSANESANSLILVATKTDIRRMLKIIRALDTSIASISSIKVFQLRFADAKALATTIQQLFAPQTTGGGGNQNNARQQFFNMMRGGPGGGPPGAAGGGGQAGQTAGTGANAAATRVVAAADENSNSLIVGASEELMTAITDMVNQLDVPMSDVVELRVFRLQNADPTELAEQLSTLFPDETTRNGTSGNQGGAVRFFGGPGGPPGIMNTQSSSSDRNRKRTRVVSVADPRTSSLIVSASTDLMPQIVEMVQQLDHSPAKKEQVAVYELQNANPQDVYQVLQDLFNRNNTMRNNNANANGSMLGQNNPLTQRATQQQQQIGSGMNSRFGASSSRTGGGGVQ